MHNVRSLETDGRLLEHLLSQLVVPSMIRTRKLREVPLSSIFISKIASAFISEKRQAIMRLNAGKIELETRK